MFREVLGEIGSIEEKFPKIGRYEGGTRQGALELQNSVTISPKPWFSVSPPIHHPVYK